jgi:hypothetical protein
MGQQQSAGFNLTRLATCEQAVPESKIMDLNNCVT